MVTGQLRASDTVQFVTQKWRMYILGRGRSPHGYRVLHSKAKTKIFSPKTIFAL